MKQIIIIRGWSVFPDNNEFCAMLSWWEYNPFEERKRRRDRLAMKVNETFQVIKPDMPNPDNASYKARKIRFEKIFPYLNDEDLVLVGHSLGWIFLLKYIAENTFPKKIKQLHLIWSCIDETDMPEEEKYLWDFLFDVDAIPSIQNKVDKIFIYHSTDDPIVPYSHAERLISYLPTAKRIIFTDRGHFKQPEFPELLENILHG